MKKTLNVLLFASVLALSSNSADNYNLVKESLRKQEQEKLSQLYEKSQKQICGKIIEEVRKDWLNIEGKITISSPYTHTVVGIGDIKSEHLNSKYVIGIRTEDNRLLSVEVLDNKGIKKESLDSIIQIGSKICFQAGNIIQVNDTNYIELPETYYYENTQFGRKLADRIKVEPSEK